MATQRYISTKFWDDEWVQEREKLQKYFYLYLLTNPLTNIAGIYQITDRRIAFDTAFTPDEIIEMWKFFDKEKKAYRHGEWVIIPSWPKHQRVTERDNCRKGIDTVLLSLPDDVFGLAVSKGYAYKYLPDLKRPLKGLEGAYKVLELSRPRSGLEPYTDLDTNKNVLVFPNNQKLCKAAYRTFEKQYGSIMPEQAKQIDAMNKLFKLSSEAGDPEVVMQAMMKKLRELKEEDDSKKGFWRTQPFLPTTLVSLWSRVREHIKTEIPDDFDWEAIRDVKV